MATTALTTLVGTIKAHLERAKISAERAEQHYISAGIHLKQLKAQKPKGDWDEYVRKTFDLGRSRADELIRIADGAITVAETRKRTAERMQKNRAKNPPSRDGGPKPEPDRHHWTEAELQKEVGRASTDEEDTENDLLGLGRIALRVADLDLKAVKSTAAMRSMTKQVIKAWEKVLANLERGD